MKFLSQAVWAAHSVVYYYFFWTKIRLCFAFTSKISTIYWITTEINDTTDYRRLCVFCWKCGNNNPLVIRYSVNVYALLSFSLTVIIRFVHNLYDACVLACMFSLSPKRTVYTTNIVCFGARAVTSMFFFLLLFTLIYSFPFPFKRLLNSLLLFVYIAIVFMFI